jgi:hypothetical protein
MRFFKREEVKALSLILLVLVLVCIPNYWVSLRKARDAQRKADFGTLLQALERYQSDFRTFPLSQDGKIAACGPYEVKIENKKKIYLYSPCRWGKDPLTDPADPTFPAYLKVLPNDPQAKKGFKYLYLSSGRTFQLYGALEGINEPEYDVKVVARNLDCGGRICNFGRAYGETPLDKSLEEYENEINETK